MARQSFESLPRRLRLRRRDGQSRTLAATSTERRREHSPPSLSTPSELITSLSYCFEPTGNGEVQIINAEDTAAVTEAAEEAPHTTAEGPKVTAITDCHLSESSVYVFSPSCDDKSIC